MTSKVYYLGEEDLGGAPNAHRGIFLRVPGCEPGLPPRLEPIADPESGEYILAEHYFDVESGMEYMIFEGVEGDGPRSLPEYRRWKTAILEKPPSLEDCGYANADASE